ncbi:MAG: hypothetical protein ACO1RX_21200 [Candidatus Sericytochromatia bacterium]
MAIPISVVIVYQSHLDPLHLRFLIDALNQQSVMQFNTFWINQSQDDRLLSQTLHNQARFPWIIQPTDHPEVGGVLCWELHTPFQAILEHPDMGRYLTYLHLECLPITHFIKNLLDVLPEIEQVYGPDVICMLQQLRCSLTVQELHPRHYLEQLRLSRPHTWYLHEDYYQVRSQMPMAYWERAWMEDAFLIPSALAHHLGLFSAVRAPLYFQDLFDVLEMLPQQPYAQHIPCLRIPDGVIYHLQHPRLFLEYRREFLTQAHQHPALFGHLSLAKISASPLHFEETAQDRQAYHTTPRLLSFYQLMRWAAQGTVSLWLQDLAHFHGTQGVMPPQSQTLSMGLKERLLSPPPPQESG